MRFFGAIVNEVARDSVPFIMVLRLKVSVFLPSGLAAQRVILHGPCTAGSFRYPPAEAVTNCIIHGYQGEIHKIKMELKLVGREISVSVTDYGVGIADIEKAMEPMFTTRPDKERSGMGFTFMEAFMDEVRVESVVGEGTTVHMKKKIGR